MFGINLGREKAARCPLAEPGMPNSLRGASHSWGAAPKAQPGLSLTRAQPGLSLTRAPSKFPSSGLNPSTPKENPTDSTGGHRVSPASFTGKSWKRLCVSLEAKRQEQRWLEHISLSNTSTLNRKRTCTSQNHRMLQLGKDLEDHQDHPVPTPPPQAIFPTQLSHSVLHSYPPTTISDNNYPAPPVPPPRKSFIFLINSYKIKKKFPLLTWCFANINFKIAFSIPDSKGSH